MNFVENEMETEILKKDSCLCGLVEPEVLDRKLVIKEVIREMASQLSL